MKPEEFASLLFEIEIISHIAHLQTTSYPEHIALNTLYSDIVGHRDSFIESYQGKYGIIKGYKISVKEGVDMVTYLKGCSEIINKFRETLEDGYLQQITDDVQELLNSTIYKLKFLK